MKAKTFYNKIGRFLPLLNLVIELPFFRIHTATMFLRYECLTIEYVRFNIKIYKWNFEFSLYDHLERYGS